MHSALFPLHKIIRSKILHSFHRPYSCATPFVTPFLTGCLKMRSCTERGGTATTSTTAASSSSVKAVDHYIAKQRKRYNHKYLEYMLHAELNNYFDNEKIGYSDQHSLRSSNDAMMSSFHNQNPKSQSAHFTSTQWSKVPSLNEGLHRNGLIGSILCEEGHMYSLAVDGDLLYTGSDSKHIRVSKSLKEFSGFKSGSGLVKAIVLSGEKIFTGHQDGKIRVWRASGKDLTVYKRVGALPNFKEFVKKSLNPKNYVEVRRHCNGLRIRHYDAVSCMSLNEEEGLLYSGSWDRTLKVWRVSDSKCVDSVNAHDDAVNSVVASFNSLVFTGSADGTVKVWRRLFDSVNGKSIITHSLHQILLKQENAVTALAANAAEGWLYCGASDGLVNFWECGKQLSHGGVLRGHKLAVLCLAAAGNLVFSGGADKSICVWRRGDGGVHTCLSVLSGHTGPVKCLAIKEDDTESAKQDKVWVVYSGSLDKSVKVWKVSEKLPEFRKMQLT